MGVGFLILLLMVVGVIVIIVIMSSSSNKAKALNEFKSSFEYKAVLGLVEELKGEGYTITEPKGTFIDSKCITSAGVDVLNNGAVQGYITVCNSESYYEMLISIIDSQHNFAVVSSGAGIVLRSSHETPKEPKWLTVAGNKLYEDYPDTVSYTPKRYR